MDFAQVFKDNFSKRYANVKERKKETKDGGDGKGRHAGRGEVGSSTNLGHLSCRPNLSTQKKKSKVQGFLNHPIFTHSFISFIPQSI